MRSGNGVELTMDEAHRRVMIPQETLTRLREDEQILMLLYPDEHVTMSLGSGDKTYRVELQDGKSFSSGSSVTLSVVSSEGDPIISSYHTFTGGGNAPCPNITHEVKRVFMTTIIQELIKTRHERWHPHLEAVAQEVEAKRAEEERLRRVVFPVEPLKCLDWESEKVV